MKNINKLSTILIFGLIYYEFIFSFSKMLICQGTSFSFLKEIVKQCDYYIFLFCFPFNYLFFGSWL